MANIIAIVGRPNVGKSTLFNRLVEKRQAIMDNQSGVTRDRHYSQGEWIGIHFTVIDTGGYVTDSEDKFESKIREQVKIAIDEASVVLFLVDCDTGITGMDKDFANIIRTTKKPVFLVANKADNTEKLHASMEFYELGLGNVFPISSADGSGTGELLDEVVKHLDKSSDNDNHEIPKISILGKPNVGKSSFVNSLLGIERTIVTDIAGTTRDAINTNYTLFGKNIILTDTAGIRKKNRIKENIEFYSILRSIQALQDSDVCVLLLDAQQGLNAQDVNIINLAHKNNKGIVIMVNKWDVIEKNNKTTEEYKKLIIEKLGTLDYIPIIFGSVYKKQRIFKVIEQAVEVYNNRIQKIATSKLNNIILKEIEKKPPPATKGKYIKIKYITQLPTHTPTFAFFCNLPQYINKTYERFLEKKIRHHFNFDGVPIRLFFRKK